MWELNEKHSEGWKDQVASDKDISDIPSALPLHRESPGLSPAPAAATLLSKDDFAEKTHSTKHTDYLHPRPVKTPQTSSICAAVWARARETENWRESKCKGLAAKVAPRMPVNESETANTKHCK